MKLILSHFLPLYLALLLSFVACKKENPVEAPQAPDYSGTWVGLASDDGQLGTSGVSVFTLNISQKGTSVSGQIVIHKAAYPEITYTGNLTGSIIPEGNIWVLKGSFNVTINENNVHATFNCTRYIDRLIGDYGGTSSQYGAITGGSFVLDRKQ